jgi:hypothetical protein
MSDNLIEAMARAICKGIGLRSWEDTPADRGDLRARVRSGQNYDVNEPNRMDYIDGAKEALNALRETLVPVGWMHTMHMEQGQTYERLLDWDGVDDDEPERTAFGLPGRDYSEEYLVTSTPLYALPENEQ